jgi:hypothetical protein
MLNMPISSETPLAAAPQRKSEKKGLNSPKQSRLVCNVCGKASGASICGMCADRIRAEALARKKREDKGEE